MSWIASTGLFVLLVQVLGGPTSGDSAESVYSTWSIAHLNLACAYSPASHFHFPTDASPFASIAPLYPLLSSFTSAIFRIGHGVVFPSSAALGAHCSTAYAAIYKWSLASGALNATLNFAFLGWIVLLSSVIVLLRVTGRGQSGWEPVALLSLAVVPPVFMSVATYFHPQDLLAIGCVLFAASSAIREKWLVVGVFLGLAFSTQQFALLAIAPLLAVVPRQNRRSLLAAIAGTTAIVDGPFILLSSGRAVKTVLFGSSRLTILGVSRFHAAGGTVLFATGLHGAALFAVSRILPIVCAFVIAYLVRRRLGADVICSETLLSLVAVSLCLRLVFEENLFGYYFAPLAVTLLCLDAVRGRPRGEVFTWMGLIMMAFNPIPWWLYLKWEAHGINLFMTLPVIFEVTILSAFVLGVRRQCIHWYLLASSFVVALTCFPPLWGRLWTNHFAPYWIWQVILVPTGLLLASAPLRGALREKRSTHLVDQVNEAT